MNIPKTSFPRIVIIGGGFAGISIAKKLKNKRSEERRVGKECRYRWSPYN